MIFDYSQLSGLTLYGNDVVGMVLFGVIALVSYGSKRAKIKKFPLFWIASFVCILSISILRNTYNDKNALDVAHSNHTIGKASGVLTEVQVLEQDRPLPTYIYRLGDVQFARRSRFTGGVFCFQKVDLKDFVNRNVVVHYSYRGNRELPDVDFKILCITKFEVLAEGNSD